MENANEMVMPEEAAFNDLMRHGDDFMNIQIYRNAREWYTKALESGVNDSLAKHKLAECEALLAKETRTKRILAIIAIVVIIAVVLLMI